MAEFLITLMHLSVTSCTALFVLYTPLVNENSYSQHQLDFQKSFGKLHSEQLLRRDSSEGYNRDCERDSGCWSQVVSNEIPFVADNEIQIFRCFIGSVG